MESKFLFDVSTLLNFSEQTLPINVKVQVKSFDIGGEEVDFRRDIVFEGIARRLSRGVQIEGEIKTEALLNCARCLEKFIFNIQIKVEEFFALKEYKAQLEENLDYYLIEGGKINLAPMIKELIALAIPFKALCSENCLGLCPSCGKKLKQSSCSCQNKDIKLKFSALKKND